MVVDVMGCESIPQLFASRYENAAFLVSLLAGWLADWLIDWPVMRIGRGAFAIQSLLTERTQTICSPFATRL